MVSDMVSYCDRCVATLKLMRKEECHCCKQFKLCRFSVIVHILFFGFLHGRVMKPMYCHAVGNKQPSVATVANALDHAVLLILCSYIFIVLDMVSYCY